MSRPFSSRSSAPPSSYVRVNGKIRAREVRIIGTDNQQLGVFSLHEAIRMAQTGGVDLVEIAPNATPPVCRLVDYGKFRYEQAKKDREARKHQHANKVKEIQLSAAIDPHDFGVKVSHAVDFLCDDMKVKVTLKFRGREMAHQELGFQLVQKFLELVAPYGHPDAAPKLIGRGINTMFSPLPRNKRAKNPRQTGDEEVVPDYDSEPDAEPEPNPGPPPPPVAPPNSKEHAKPPPSHGTETKTAAFGHNPFAQLDEKLGLSK